LETTSDSTFSMLVSWRASYDARKETSIEKVLSDVVSNF